MPFRLRRTGVMPRHWKCSPLLTIKNPFPGARMPHTWVDSGGRMKKTHGMRGWECLVDGVADIDVSMTDERLFSVVIRQSSGQCTEKTFSLPVMLYRGVFRAGETYHPGDTVTWGGSLWHCNSMTGDKPGEAHSSGWTLAAKRGRDAGGGK